MLIRLLKIIGNFTYKSMTFDTVPDKVHEDIQYNKPYITSTAGCMTIYLNFKLDKLHIHVYEIRCEDPERMSQKIFSLVV